MFAQNTVMFPSKHLGRVNSYPVMPSRKNPGVNRLEPAVRHGQRFSSSVATMPSPGLGPHGVPGPERCQQAREQGWVQFLKMWLQGGFVVNSPSLLSSRPREMPVLFTASPPRVQLLGP